MFRDRITQRQFVQPVKPDLLHATAIAIDGNGVLLLGPSGSGKSDLALRLIDRGAMLISDDVVMMDNDGRKPLLHSAPNIEAKMEVRGVGILQFPVTSGTPLRLAVELANTIERLPIGDETKPIGNFNVPSIMLAPFKASAAIKLELALRSIVDADRWPVARHRSDDAQDPAL